MVDFSFLLLLKMTQSPLSTSVGVNVKPAAMLEFSDLQAFILAAASQQSADWKTLFAVADDARQKRRVA